jgi:hypothetical protein
MVHSVLAAETFPDSLILPPALMASPKPPTLVTTSLSIAQPLVDVTRTGDVKRQEERIKQLTRRDLDIVVGQLWKGGLTLNARLGVLSILIEDANSKGANHQKPSCEPWSLFQRNHS